MNNEIIDLTTATAEVTADFNPSEESVEVGRQKYPILKGLKVSNVFPKSEITVLRRIPKNTGASFVKVCTYFSCFLKCIPTHKDGFAILYVSSYGGDENSLTNRLKSCEPYSVRFSHKHT